MSDLTLKDLIKIEGLDYENLKFKVVRHKMNSKEWEDFDNLIRFDNEMLKTLINCLFPTATSFPSIMPMIPLPAMDRNS